MAFDVAGQRVIREIHHVDLDASIADPTHPIAEGVGPAIVIPKHEMYGEFFDIPTPDALGAVKRAAQSLSMTSRPSTAEA